MNLLNLPEEILVAIIKQLDFKTVYSLYETCEYLKQVILRWRVVQECRLSLNTMATARTLKLNFFKDISANLRELNMSGVPDLCKTILLSAARKLKSLKSLDVSYTNININDFLEILKVCPTIKDIAINFVFRNNIEIIELQNAFQPLINVHFVGSIAGLLNSKLSICILKDAQLDNLQFTIIERFIPGELQCYRNCSTMVKFSRFSIFILVSDLCCDITVSLALSLLDETKCEFMATNMNLLDTNISFHATPLIEQFIRQNFTNNVTYDTKVKEFVPSMFSSTISITFWDKNSTIFDDNFYRKLLKELKDMYIFNCDPKMGSSAPAVYDCYCIAPSVANVCNTEESRIDNNLFKKRRLAAPSLMMNYDTLFKEKKDLQLIVSFPSFMRSSVSLSSSSEFLKKITFLSLGGDASYSAEFFNILFRCCDNLITLDLVLSSIGTHPIMSSLFRSLPLNKTLKNFRLVSHDLDFKTIFHSLSQSKMLENIHLVDKFVTNTYNAATSDMYDPTLVFSNCDNLYNIYILTTMTNRVLSSTLQLFHKAKSRFNRHNLNIEIDVLGKPPFRQYSIKFYKYNPFLEVFRIFRLKPSVVSRFRK